MMGRRVPRAARLSGLVVVLPVLLFGAGCATAGAAFRAGPAGIPAERSIRTNLSTGRAASAWAAMSDKKIAPRDALLRHMYRGVIAMHSGDHEAGTRSLDRAWTVAEDRYTKSVSRGALSMMTAEATLPYGPGITERMLIPYYGGLNWLARNERYEAGVEARRLASLLAADAGPKPPAEMVGVLRYVSGVMFEAAGERQDALVAYRNAAAVMGSLPGDTTLAGPDSGDVVVIVEDGFVGRPEPREFGVYMDGDELVALTTGGRQSRLAMAQVVERRSWDRHNGLRNDLNVGWLTYEINWATFGEPMRSRGGVAVRSGECVAPFIAADVTAAVQADFERAQPGRLTRAIARTAVRFAAERAADKAFEKAGETRKKRKEKGEKGGGWGSILLGIGLMATSISSSVIDQPDLRAWQVLPDRMTVARLRLPVGEHPVEVVVGDEVVSLGTVSVQPGGVAVMTYRRWP
jgi:hypothetical protein